MEPQNPQPVPYSSGPGRGKSISFTILLTALLIISLVFGGWAFSKMQDYKNNSDKKSAAAVESAKKTQDAQLQAQFDEQNKSPNKTFHGSATYGSISFNYPKTWSAYVDTSSTNEPINAYFHPNEVPGTQNKTAYALRLELLATDYAQIVQQFSSQIQQGTLTAKAYAPPKLNGVANAQPGTLFSGQINSQDTTQVGALLAIKVRDKTLEISTQSADYLADFNNVILPSLSFVP